MAPRTLLHIPPHRIAEELRRVELANEADRVYQRRRNKYIAIGTIIWLAGFVVGGGAFRTTNMELASALLLLSPLMSGMGPVIVLYVFWIRSGEM